MTKRKRTIQLKIPEGAEPGVDSLTCVVDGSEIEIPIPHDSKVGDTLQIQLGENENDDDDDDDDCRNASAGDSSITKVKLHDSIGVTLDIHSSVPGHDDDDDDDDDNNDEKKDGADGTYAMPWPAGLHLTKHISSPQLKGIIEGSRNVVELGSGSGLVGLAVAAMILSQRAERERKRKRRKVADDAPSPSPTSSNSPPDTKEPDLKTNITLTDFPSAIPLLEHNIKINRDRICSSTNYSICYSAESLVWGTCTDARTNEKDTDVNEKKKSSENNVDLIIGSDLLYNAKPETYDDLCSTIRDLDSAKKARIILSVRWRKPESEREFFEKMEAAGYKFNLVVFNNDGNGNGDGDDDDCDLGWKDFGNPKCSRSNEYFTNSYIQVDGESKPLKDVSEEDMDVMSDKEYNSFEKRFIQIYVSENDTSICSVTK